jgi:hypothetical protein
LQKATTKTNAHGELILSVKQIEDVLIFIEPFTFIPLTHFDPFTQSIDKIAQTYLSQCQ